MAQQPPAPGTWEEDPAAASILVATGRPRHDLLVVADPGLLTELDAAWGAPDASVRLSFLPGVSAPVSPGQEDALLSYDRWGLGVLVARGRTSLYEGRPARRVTAMARTAAGSGLRAAVLATRAASLGQAAVGDVLVVSDHMSLLGTPLFPAPEPVEAAWDEELTERVAALDGVLGRGVLALVPGPVRPTRTEASILAALGADAVVMDGVAEAMALASRGVRVVGLACVDSLAGPAETGRRDARSAGRRATRAQEPARAPAQVRGSRRGGQWSAPRVVRAAIETVLTALR